MRTDGDEDSDPVREQERVIDRTLVMIGLMILKESLFKSGYTAELQKAVSDRIDGLLRKMGVDESGT